MVAERASMRLCGNRLEGWRSHQERKNTRNHVCSLLRAIRSLLLWARKGKYSPGDLLSGHIGVVICLDLELTILGPEVDRGADASNTALVDLASCQLRLYCTMRPQLHTISAASVPPMENSMSAYLIQKP